jgi:hypothetical protein
MGLGFARLARSIKTSARASIRLRCILLECKPTLDLPDGIDLARLASLLIRRRSKMLLGKEASVVAVIPFRCYPRLAE